MGRVLTDAGLGLVAFVVLDGVWLGVLMKGFYREQLGPIARMTDGNLTPVWSVAAFVYVLLALGIAVFVMPRASSMASAAAFGAVFGLVAYGVYDLTNYSTLARFPGVVVTVDIAWGMTSCALAAAVVKWLG